MLRGTISENELFKNQNLKQAAEFLLNIFFFSKKHKAQTFQGLSAESINAKLVDTFYADEMWWGKSWN